MCFFTYFIVRERSGSVVECLTRASPASLRCGPWARHIYPSLVLVQPRKTRPCLTERLLMGRKESNQTNKTINKHIGDWNCRHRTKTPERGSVKKQIKTNKINYFFAKKKKKILQINVRYLSYIFKSKPRAKILFKMLLSHENVGSAQWTLHWAEGLWPTTIKSQVVKIVITWSIRPNENNNIELVYYCFKDA